MPAIFATGPDRLAFHCPACETIHQVSTTHWTFNGDFNKPTLSPSIKVTGVQRATDDEIDRLTKGEVVEPRPLVCHSFVRDGRIEFCGDCTHDCSGKTLDLPVVQSLDDLLGI